MDSSQYSTAEYATTPPSTVKETTKLDVEFAPETDSMEKGLKAEPDTKNINGRYSQCTSALELIYSVLEWGYYSATFLCSLALFVWSTIAYVDSADALRTLRSRWLLLLMFETLVYVVLMLAPVSANLVAAILLYDLFKQCLDHFDGDEGSPGEDSEKSSAAGETEPMSNGKDLESVSSVEEGKEALEEDQYSAIGEDDPLITA